MFCCAGRSILVTRLFRHVGSFSPSPLSVVSIGRIEWKQPLKVKWVLNKPPWPLYARKGAPVPIEQGSGRPKAPVWMFFREEKIFAPLGIQNAERPSRNLASILSVQGYSKWLSGFQQLVIHNTLEIAVCVFFLFNRKTLQLFVTYLTGALYVHRLWFYRHQHDHPVRSKPYVACQRTII
jgi:hypothetical protein